MLLVGDDDRVVDALKENLGIQRYQTMHQPLGDGVSAAARMADVVVLDFGSGDSKGLAQLRRLRQVSNVPIFVLSTRRDEQSIVRGLHSGADDYMAHPIRARELGARIFALVRRATNLDPAHHRNVRLEDVHINFDARTVTIGAKTVQLTTKELHIVAVLAREIGNAVSRKDIVEEVWPGVNPSANRTLDVHIRALREKIDTPDLIQTIWGYGYRLGSPARTSRDDLAGRSLHSHDPQLSISGRVVLEGRAPSRKEPPTADR